MGILIRSNGTCTDRTLPMQNPLWTPSLLTTAVAQFDCQSGIMADGSNVVSAWTDSLGSKVATAASGTQPVKGYALLDKTAVEMTADFFTMPSFGSAVGQWGFWAAIDAVSNVAGTSTYLAAWPTTLLVDLNNAAAGNNGRITGTGTNANLGSLTGKHVIVGYITSDNVMHARKDGVEIGTGTGWTAAALPTSGGFLGQYWGGQSSTRPADLALGQFGLLAGNPSLLDIQKLEGYLAQRFFAASFLPVGHPYRSVAPRKLG